MGSSFNWLDYSEHDRRKMLDVISLFQEQDTRDELGIGSIRDAFADLLFPGTSTIQTRARYFLFIPWMYLKLEDRKVASQVVSRRARDEETALIDVLVQSTDGRGTIGRRARKNLKRLPSNIYWQGLGRWQIRLLHGSQEQYHRYLDSHYSRREAQRENDDGEVSEGRIRRNWHPGIPAPPNDFPRAVSLGLTPPEARYLRERILTSSPHSLLAFLVDEGQLTGAIEFVWEHPQLAEFSSNIREQLKHARNFAETFHGAALLYNLMLAQQSDRKPLVKDYRDRLTRWSSLLASRGDSLMTWDRQRFWEIARSTDQRISHPTQFFVDCWLEMCLANIVSFDPAGNKRARQLVHDRETMLKRGLARLDNVRARELWNGKSGAAQLDYRWSTAQGIITDILIALAGPKSDA